MEYVIKSLAVIQNGRTSTYKHAFESSSFSNIKYEMRNIKFKTTKRERGSHEMNIWACQGVNMVNKYLTNRTTNEMNHMNYGRKNVNEIHLVLLSLDLGSIIQNIAA